MPALPIVLVLGAASASPLTFPADESGTPVDVTALEASGAVLGRTGRLLVAAARGPWMGDPRVARVEDAGHGVWRVTPRPGIDELALAWEWWESGAVRWANADLVFAAGPAALPADPWVDRQWHLENTGQGGRAVDADIDLGDALAFTDGAGQLVAVLDSGVQLDHPSLSVVGGLDYIGRDDDANPSTDDAAPHGTACAGVVAARADGVGGVGVAPGADIYAIRLIGGGTSTDDIRDAFYEAVDAGATVLSNSWGVGSTCAPFPTIASFRDMLRYAETDGRDGRGAAVVFAAGNGNCDIEADGLQSVPTVISVAAVEGGDRRAWYSNFGSHVDIAAPTSLLTTDMAPGGYGSFEGDDSWADGFGGTSAATPVVAGTLALMFAANPRLTAEDARAVLCETATRNDHALAEYDAAGWSPWYGCGRVDAGAAVAVVADLGPPTAPALLPHGGEMPAERVLLRWSPGADPDGLAVDTEVELVIEGGAPELRAVGRDRDALDLSGTLLDGVSVVWRARHLDAWGPGEWSEAAAFTVGAPAAPAGPPAPAASGAEGDPSGLGAGCATGGMGPAAGFGALAVLSVGLGARRRRR